MILHSKIYGNYPYHLLIFHGLFGMSDNWLNIAQKIFYQGITVHTVDLRNHGNSFHDDEMSFQHLALDIFNYVNHHKIKNFSLLGHSIGGKAIIEYVFTYPFRLPNKIIVADIAPKSYPPIHQPIIDVLNNINFEELKSRREIEEYLKHFISNLKIVQFLLKSLFWNKEKKLDFRFNLKSITANYSNLIKKSNKIGVFNNPSLFLSGDQSDYIVKEDKLLITNQFTNALFDTITNSGHWLHADNPEEFVKKTNFFLLS